jgi:hypothetical protein
MKDNRTKYIFAGLAALILLLSFIPRFYDILKFLPDYSVDENEIVEYAAGYLGGTDYDQRFYSYGPLLSYVMMLIYKVMSWFSPGTIDDFAQKVFFDNTSLYYAARFVNSLISLATAFVVFKIIGRIWNSKIALMTLPLLVFPFAEQLTAFTTRVDMLLGLTYALALYFMLKYSESKTWKHLLLTALFTGMGFACKPLPALLILPSLFIGFSFLHFYPVTEKREILPSARIAKKNKRAAAQPKYEIITLEDNTNFIQKIFRSIPRVLTDGKFYAFLIVMFIAAYIFFPHAFKNWSAPNGFKEQQLGRISYETGKDGIPGWNLYNYLKVYEWPLLALSIVGLLYSVIIGFVRKNYAQIIVTLLPIITLIVFAKGPARVYWYTPIASLLLVGVAAIFYEISERVKSKNVQLSAIVGLLVLLLVLPSKSLFSRSQKLNTHSNFNEMLTSLAAKAWAEENIPTNSNIAFYGYYTFLPRLVTKDPNMQASLGEYFMYFKSGNQYYVQQFGLAHQKYVANPENKVYNIFGSLPFVDQNQQKQNLPLRYQNDEFEPYLKQLLQLNKIPYLISQYKLKPEWDEYLVKAFTKEKIPYGDDVYIYKIE